MMFYVFLPSVFLDPETFQELIAIAICGMKSKTVLFLNLWR